MIVGQTRRESCTIITLVRQIAEPSLIKNFILALNNPFFFSTGEHPAII